MGLSVGANVVVSTAYGAKKFDKIHRTVLFLKHHYHLLVKIMEQKNITALTEYYLIHL